MKTYRRIEGPAPWQKITEVDETGKYVQYVAWPDGGTTLVSKSTIQYMGWPNLKTFLHNRPGFVLVEDA